MQQRKFVKVQDSHPHNQYIRGATVVLNLYIIMYQNSITVTPTLFTVAVRNIQTCEDDEHLSACC